MKTLLDETSRSPAEVRRAIQRTIRSRIDEDARYARETRDMQTLAVFLVSASALAFLVLMLRSLTF